MSATIAMTGASGFVGRRTAEILLASGARVKALVRDPAKLDASAARHMQVLEGGLLDEGALDRLTDGVEAVIHCAGEISDPSRFEEANVEGPRRLAAAALRQRVARIVHVSSLAAREPRISAYGASKLSGEAAMRGVAGSLAMIVRPPAVYGPGDRGTLPLIAQLTRSRAMLPGTPEQRFSLIHVDDLAHALLTLAFAPPLSGGMHELDDGRRQGYSWPELARIAGEAQGMRIRTTHLPRGLLSAAATAAETWARLTSRPPALTRGKVAELYHHDWVCRNDLLDQVCAWKPKLGFAEGFAMTVDWYRNEGWLPPGKAATGAPAGAEQGRRVG